MYRRIFVGALGILFLISGCGSATSTSHPSYNIFKSVPNSQLTAVKQAVKKASVKNLELPTKLPYKVTAVHCPSPTSPLGPVHNISIDMGNMEHVLDVDAWANFSNKPISGQDISMAGEKVTKLSDGTKALYGINGAVSQLAWIESNVMYTLVSTNKDNKPDLNEKQLIQVADSFK